MKPQSTPSFAAFVGIGGADRKHDFCLQAAGSDQRVFGTMDHSPEDIAKRAYSLRDRFGGTIAIRLELAKGPLVYALQRFEFLVLFPVHPSTLAKYREAFVPSHAKDDPADAEMALDIMLRHPDTLQPIRLQSVATRTLATLVEERRCLVNDVASITNRMSSTLKQYYPQVSANRNHTHPLGTLLAEQDGLKSGALLCVFQVLLEVTKPCLTFAHNFLILAFSFRFLVACELAGDFIGLAFRFFGAALNLICVDAHNLLLTTYAGKRPARRT